MLAEDPFAQDAELGAHVLAHRVGTCACYARKLRSRRIEIVAGWGRGLRRTNMRQPRKTPSFKALRAASARASGAARAASRKRDTRCEIVLRRELWRLGMWYRIAWAGLVGRPDVVFGRARVAVFCDGDFWHGRGLAARERKLKAGHNATYWLAKIRTNVARDMRQTSELEQDGWLVLRFWETDIKRDPAAISTQIAAIVRARVGSSR